MLFFVEVFFYMPALELTNIKGFYLEIPFRVAVIDAVAHAYSHK